MSVETDEAHSVQLSAPLRSAPSGNNRRTFPIREVGQTMSAVGQCWGARSSPLLLIKFFRLPSSADVPVLRIMADSLEYQRGMAG